MVNEKSACIDGHRKLGLPTDHLKINKYSGPQDPSFQCVYPAIKEMAKNAVKIVQQRLSPRAIVLDNSNVPKEYLECLQSLFLTNPPDDLAAIRRSKGKRVEGTCEWLLVQEEYTTWLVEDNTRLLRLVGAPGIGKTMISSFLVYELEERVRRSPNMIFAYYFCDNKNEKRNTATAIIRGLLLQLLRQNHNLFEHIQGDYNQMKDRLFDNFDALWRILLKILRDFNAGEIYLLIDALDECEKSTRRDLLISLAELFTSPQTGGTANVKFLVTCRPEEDIQNYLFDINGYLRVDSAKVNADLSKFIQVKVNDLSRKKRYSDELKNKVQSALITKAEGTFLWASLVLADLESCYKHQVEKKLRTLPSDLNGVYDRILKQIEIGCEEDAKFVLRCAVVARRPLTADELAMAYALELGGWAANTIPPGGFLDDLREIFKTCEPIVYLDNRNQTINLVHQSAKEYLLSEYLKANRELTQYHVVSDKANLLIFRVCWRYLSMEEFDQGNKIISRSRDNILRRVYLQDLQEYCFFNYASQEWDEHALVASPALVTDYEFKKDNLDKISSLRDTWLSRAAAEGQEVVVRLLLEKGAELESKDNYGRTPLSRAAENGHEAVVKLLLEKGAELESKDNDYGQTPLLWAAENGHEAVVKLLLQKGAELESKDNYGRTPLSWAARNGHEAVVKLLVEKGAELESKDKFGQTPLSWAAENRHEAVVKLLLEKGAELGSKDNYGQTPLSRAARNGHEAVVKLLLEKGAEKLLH